MLFPKTQDVPEVIAIGGSAGAIRSLQYIIKDLPSDFIVPILIAVHMSATHKSLLPKVLQRSTQLPVYEVPPAHVLEKGIYVSDSTHYLNVIGGRVNAVNRPAEYGARAAVDCLFESVAEEYGRLCIGLLLGGSQRDGVTGLALIRARGGNNHRRSNVC